MLHTWLASLPPEWTAGCSNRVFERAVSAYGSPGRRYHTWQHALACVEELRTVQVVDGRTVFLALVFHDAIYVAGHADNERRSADLALAILGTDAACQQSELGAIERMILATRDHQKAGAGLDSDGQTMLDIDMSIVGADRQTYAWYATAIRDEYVPAAATERRFRIGRIEFLRRLGTMPHVFLTPEGRKRWETSARANLAWEESHLRAELAFVDRLVLRWRRLRR